MIKKIFLLQALVLVMFLPLTAQPLLADRGMCALSVLPWDGVLPYWHYMDCDSMSEQEKALGNAVQFFPKANFFFRPETTNNYKEAGLPIDTGHLNFYLRGDVGGIISLPKKIDLVFTLQSYGLYTRSLGPLDPSLSLYEAYADIKSLDKNGRLSLRFGRMSPGKYGTEILVGNDDFIKGRSFESVRLRRQTSTMTNDLMWIQLYQEAPDSANFDWNHPIFLASMNTFHFSDRISLDVNLPYIIDQYNSGYRTSVAMPDVRLWGRSGDWRYSAELIYQTGITRGVIADEKLGNVQAYAMELSAGFQPIEGPVGADITFYRASGDDQPGDEEIRSYNVLWQNEHRRFGHIDAFKGSNVQAITLGLNWRFHDDIDLGLHVVTASVLEPADRSPGVATITSLQDLDTDSKALGTGGDVYLNYYFSQHLNMQFSASVFSPGEYFTAVNGIDETMMRLYLLLAVRI